MISSLGYIVHVSESTGCMVSEVLGYGSIVSHYPIGLTGSVILVELFCLLCCICTCHFLILKYQKH